MDLSKKKLSAGAGGLVWLRGVPFSDEIMTDEAPPNIFPLNFEYDGTTDPWDHLCRFENFDLLCPHTDGVKCRLFLTTLTKSALRWFDQLPAKSIHSFEEFSLDFLKQFRIRIRKYHNPLSSLHAVKQKEGEGLRNYIERFATAALEVPSASHDDLYFALAPGLRDGEFTEALDEDPPGTFSDLIDAAEKYSIKEEVRKMNEGQVEETKEMKRKRNVKLKMKEGQVEEKMERKRKRKVKL